MINENEEREYINNIVDKIDKWTRDNPDKNEKGGSSNSEFWPLAWLSPRRDQILAVVQVMDKLNMIDQKDKND